jgi:hypothetical protein
MGRSGASTGLQRRKLEIKNPTFIVKKTQVEQPDGPDQNPTI